MKQETARESFSDKPSCRVSRLPFSEIPHQSRLFLQFQNDPDSLRKYYPNVFSNPSEVAAYVPTVLANYVTDRQILCDALENLNQSIGAGQLTFEHIELLRDRDTVAVLTGQQAGLFSGPLYTVYKALSTVKLAEQLRAEGVNAVPVFWAATEDHDFDEVSIAHFTGTNGPFSEQVQPIGRIPDSPVGSTLVPEDIRDAIDRVFDELPATVFTQEVKEITVSAWAEGSLFGEAFGKYLAAILMKYGVIFVDPRDTWIKKLSAPIYRLAVERSREMVASIVSRGRDLIENGFHLQVLVEEDYFPLFWHNDDGQRIAIRRATDGVLKVKESNLSFSQDDLAEAALNTPERFSPGVMLRPVVQDFLFPTVCYFGGGAEVAYFAQNSEVYRVLDRPVTPIFHRQSFTIIEPKQKRILDKFGLGLKDLFVGQDTLQIELAARSISPDIAALFAEVEKQINVEMNRLDLAVGEIEPTLAANVTRRRQKIIFHIAALRRKTLLARLRNDEISSRQINEIFTSLVPDGELQERSINVLTFLNKYGLNFIDWVYQAIDIDDREHRLLEI